MPGVWRNCHDDCYGLRLLLLASLVERLIVIDTHQFAYLKVFGLGGARVARDLDLFGILYNALYSYNHAELPNI